MRSDWGCFCLVVRQRLLMAARHVEQLWQPLVFFMLVMLLFPLAMGTDPALLSRIIPGIVWVAVLLSLLLSLQASFSEDHRDGTLESWLSAPHPLAWIVLAKVCADWLLALLPLMVCLPIVALLFHLSFHIVLNLMITLLLGTPVLYGIGSIFSALLVGFRQSSWLLALLLLPVAIPVLIMGCSALQAVSEGSSCAVQLAVMGILALLVLLLFPFATASALRIGLQQD